MHDVTTQDDAKAMQALLASEEEQLAKQRVEDRCQRITAGPALAAMALLASSWPSVPMPITSFRAPAQRPTSPEVQAEYIAAAEAKRARRAAARRLP